VSKSVNKLLERLGRSVERGYYYKEMGVHVLDAVIRDWFEPPQHPPPFPLRALEEEEPSFGLESRRSLCFCVSQLLHVVRFLALLEQALATSDIPTTPPFPLRAPEKERIEFWFGIASATLFSCVPTPPRNTFFGAS